MPRPNSAPMPLLASLQKYLSEQVRPFHTPGHKGGRGAHDSLRQWLGDSALAHDLTVVPGIGDLFDQQGPIQDSQRLTAFLYGASESYFLVNGTTGGILAMMLATVGPGEKIILPRNVHRSAVSGLVLSGAIPVFVEAAVDLELQIAMNTTVENYETAMHLHPDAKAVMLLNPTYYGVTTDIDAVVRQAHRRNMTVLVDEAHGPHLRFSDRLPQSALSAGADLVVQSTHKILGALSQASILHCQGDRVDAGRLQTMLQLVQSSSPNYLLLASLEAAVTQLTESGEALIDHAIQLAEQARGRINVIEGLYCLGRERLGQPGMHGLDPTKLTVCVSRLGLRGNDAAEWLRCRCRVQAELADAANVLFLITLGDDSAAVDCLVNALTDLAQTYDGAGSEPEFPALPLNPPVSVPSLSPRQAMFTAREKIPFAKTCGRISAETVTCYPPGIPLLVPGEAITPQAVEYCLALQRQGYTILGPQDPRLQLLEVVA